MARSAGSVVSVVEAVERELAPLPVALRDGALAASALALAAAIDAPGSATSKAMVAKELRETLAVLRALAPPAREADSIDDIAAQREKRRAAAGLPAAADLSRP